MYLNALFSGLKSYQKVQQKTSFSMIIIIIYFTFKLASDRNVQSQNFQTKI